MDEINKINLSEQTKFRLDEISKIENYLINEINETKSCCKKLNKYFTIFNYIDKMFIVLCATSGGVSIISFSGVIGVPAGASASFTLIFSLVTGYIRCILVIRYNKKEKEKAR